MYMHWSSRIEDQTTYGQNFLTSNLICYLSSLPSHFEIELFNIACRQDRTELIEWLLVHHVHVHFHFNYAFTETLKRMGSNRHNMLKLLLFKLDHTFLDIESIIQNCCRQWEFDIVRWMLNTFDPHLADIRSIMTKACQNGALHLVQFIIRQYGIRMYRFYIKKCMVKFEK
jgi:hypothetical protein